MPSPDRTKELDQGIWIDAPQYDIPICPDIIKVHKSIVLQDGTTINEKEYNKVDGKWIEKES